MIVTLSGVTGTGKSYFKYVISKELNFKNLVIVTTRVKREKEIPGIDKEFVSKELFEKMKNDNILTVDFDFLGEKYAYRKSDLEANSNQVTELHYSTIYDFKKSAKNVFAVYMIPCNLERAKKELIKRNLPLDVQKRRIKEVEEHMNSFFHDEELQKQFDYIFINDYTVNSKKKLINIIREKLG